MKEESKSKKKTVRLRADRREGKTNGILVAEATFVVLAVRVYY